MPPRLVASVAALLICLLLLWRAPAPALAVYGGGPTSVPPWMAFVGVDLGDGSEQLCGGTAIAPNVVLTAAHCVFNDSTHSYVTADQVRVVFGLDDPWDALNNADTPGVPVSGYAYPLKFGITNTGGTTTDVALLQVSSPAAATVPVVPEDRPDLWTPGTTGTLMGWGLTNDSDPSSTPVRLQSAALTVDSDQRCARAIPGYNAGVMLCAGAPATAAPCSGDSGGPLIVTDAAGNPYVAGVVNFGGPCQNAQGPSVFARVGGQSLGDFIAAYTARLQQQADSQPPPPPPAATPSSSPPPALGRLSDSAVPGDLDRALSRALGSRYRRPRSWRRRCQRRSGSQFSCSVTWLKGSARYYGSVLLLLRYDAQLKRVVAAYSIRIDALAGGCPAPARSGRCRPRLLAASGALPTRYVPRGRRVPHPSLPSRRR